MKTFLFVILVNVFEPIAYGFVPASELFAYGPANGDTQLPIADDNFVNVTLRLGHVFHFFNSSYSSLFVNNNGAISFIEGVSQYTPTCAPLSVPMIVPFWADVDTRNGGTVNYRETTNRSMLLKASDEIRRAFPSFNNINLGWSFIITWDDVAFYGANAACGGTDKRNTFQTILTTDGSKSFAIFLYNAITWTTGTASAGNGCDGLGGTPAKAGFDVGDGSTFFDIADTCTDAILNITETTNVGQDGKWIFRIDNDFQSSGCLRSDEAALEQLKISPSLMSIFGNNPITIKGPCMTDATRVRCRFNDISPRTVDAVVSENVATCVVPYLYTNGRIKVDLLVIRTCGTEETFSGYIYTIKPNHELPFHLVGTSQLTLTWDVANFGGGNPTQTLDLELVEFIGGVWISRGVVKENLSNIGSYSGPLNSRGVTAFADLRSVYVVQLRPSSQLGNNVVANDNTNSIVSDILYTLVHKTDTEIDELCNGWYIIDGGAPTDALPCPPLLSQAMIDDRFEVVEDLLTYNPGAEQGYRQRVPSASGAGQRCTYRNGRIIVGPRSGGNVRSVSPNGNFGVVRHAVADLLPWYTCCKFSTNPANCDKYYNRRPSDTGINYIPPATTAAFGDPHIITYDRVSYTFNGVGEFWMIKGENDSFLMQARMAQFINSAGVPTSASVFTAFVMQQKICNGNVKIQVTLTLNGIQVTLDGEHVALDLEPNQQKRTIMHNGASIDIYSTQDVRITFRSGYSFAFTVAGGTAINMRSMASVDLKGQTKGLLGVFDGNRNNEYTCPDGVVISPTANSTRIHDFGMQWRIDAENSLFTYPSGTTYASYQNEFFVPNFDVPNLNNLSPEDVAACRGCVECLFDLFVTGSADFANSTLDAIETFNRTAEIVDTVVGVCERPTTPENGFLTADNYLVGSTVNLVCNSDLQVTGHDTLTCTTYSNGVHSWNAEFGTCTAVVLNPCANENAWLQWLCEVGLSG